MTRILAQTFKTFFVNSGWNPLNMIWISILWLVMNLLFCFPLYSMIYNYILTKPLISVSLVDLIYLDCILHICSICAVATIANIHCLAILEEHLTISYTISIIYSGITKTVCTKKQIAISLLLQHLPLC